MNRELVIRGKKLETSELDKMHAVREKSQIIGDFLAWMATNRLTICELDNRDNYQPDFVSIEKRLARYFNIDLNKVEKERLAILNELGD